MSDFDPVEKPKHYNVHPSGVEAIQLCERLSFNLGNAVKYLFRCDHKGSALEDLKKARWYLNRHINHDVDVVVFVKYELVARGLIGRIADAAPESLLAHVLLELRSYMDDPYLYFGAVECMVRLVDAEIARRS